MSDLIQPVISRPESSKVYKVDRLLKYCEDMDGTKVKIISISREEDASIINALKQRGFSDIQAFYCLQAYALHKEALAMQGKPFIHLEPDSIPLKSGWVKSLSNEYRMLGKPYMWAIDSHPPGDLVGGIGIYGPEAAMQIPYEFPVSGWDLWMYNNIPDLISKTPLIQHKYGIYDSEGIFKTDDLIFPRDQALIRPETILFHRDPSQSLIPTGDKRFAHSGCMGDTIAALSAIQQLGGGHIIMTQKNNKRILRGERYEFLKPLLEYQTYVQSVTWEENPQNIDHDFTDFRTIYKGDISLAHTQSNFIGIKHLNTDPWLDAPSDPRSKGKFVIARSPRYLSWIFPWAALVQQFGNRILFIGLPEEKLAFETYVGIQVDSIICKDALEMASLIQGCDCFIGNQSSPFWMAIALGKTLIQETYLPNPDSVIPRENATYFRNQSQRRHIFNMLKRL